MLGCSVRLRIKVKVGKWHRGLFKSTKKDYGECYVRLNLGFRDRDGVYG